MPPALWLVQGVSVQGAPMGVSQQGTLALGRLWKDSTHLNSLSVPSVPPPTWPLPVWGDRGTGTLCPVQDSWARGWGGAAETSVGVGADQSRCPDVPPCLLSEPGALDFSAGANGTTMSWPDWAPGLTYCIEWQPQDQNTSAATCALTTPKDQDPAGTGTMMAVAAACLCSLR